MKIKYDYDYENILYKYDVSHPKIEIKRKRIINKFIKYIIKN
jgi:hypothetical protein